MSNILLTGLPRTGKTTIIQKVISHLTQCTGFYTEETKEQSTRVGFRLVTLDNRECILSHKRIKSPYRVGKYRIDCNCIEAGVQAIQQGIKQHSTIIIDEIGKMELFSQSFKQAVLNALDSASPVLGTILVRPHPFCDSIKQRSDVTIIEVTMENRDNLPAEILHKLRE